MNEIASVMRHRAEIARAVRNGQYEVSPAGIHFIRQGVMLNGVMDTEHRRGGDLIDRDLSSNIIPTEGLNHILNVIAGGTAQVNPWYVSIFEGNYTPVAGVTAATYPAAATESTAYTEANRVTYVEGAAAAGVMDNSASRAVFTMNATKTIYGGALNSAQAKSATSGTLLAAVRFAVARAVVNLDELAVKYTLTATST